MYQLIHQFFLNLDKSINSNTEACSSVLNKQTYKVKFSINERIEPKKFRKIDEENDDQNEKNILVNTIIKTKSISPTIVEDEYFKFFIKELKPQFELPTKEELELNILKNK